jgi:hypothetical protein
MRRSAIVAATLLLFSPDMAYAVLVPLHDYSITIGYDRFGIVDWTSTLSSPPDDPPISYTSLHFGPLGDLKVPFTARQGLAGLVATLLLAAVLILVMIRRSQHRAA